MLNYDPQAERDLWVKRLSSFKAKNQAYVTSLGCQFNEDRSLPGQPFHKIAEILEKVTRELMSRLRSKVHINDIDHHKLMACRCLASYKLVHYIFVPINGTKGAEKHLVSRFCVSLIAAGLPQIDPVSFYADPKRKIDLALMMSAQLPPILSLSMIGFLLEKEFPI